MNRHEMQELVAATAYKQRIGETRLQAAGGPVVVPAHVAPKPDPIVGYCVKGGGGDVCVDCGEPAAMYVAIRLSDAVKDNASARARFGTPAYECEGCGRVFGEDGVEDDD